MIINKKTGKCSPHAGLNSLISIIFSDAFSLEGKVPMKVVTKNMQTLMAMISVLLLIY